MERCRRCGSEMGEWDRREDIIFYRCSGCGRGISAEFTKEGLRKSKEDFQRSGKREKMEQCLHKEVERLGGIDNIMKLPLTDVFTEIVGNLLHDLSGGEVEIMGAIKLYKKEEK